MAAVPSRCADVAAFSLPADPDVGLSGTSLQDDAGRAAKSFWVDGLAALCKVVGEARGSVFCLFSKR